jgi:hypothetical protein
MSFLKRWFADADSDADLDARPERRTERQASADAVSGELSDADLEEVHGGLERMHLPAAFEMAEVEIR